MRAHAALRSGRLLSTAFLATLVGRLRRGPLRPSWSFGFEVFRTMLRRDWDEIWHWDPSRLRSYLDALRAPGDRSRLCRLSHETIGGVPCTRIEPPEMRGGGREVLVYFHGGSYLCGSIHTHGDVMSRFAIALRRPVLAPWYRLAPEHPWPAQLDDALAVVRAAMADCRIAIAGDSAGGHLVLATARELRARGETLPAAVVALSPWLDFEARTASYARNAPYDYGTREMLIAQAKLVAGARPPRELSLAGSAPVDVGPLFLQVGGAELLHDEVAAFAESMRAAGFSAELDVLPDMPHAASNLASVWAEGARAVERAARFISESSLRSHWRVITGSH